MKQDFSIKISQEDSFTIIHTRGDITSETDEIIISQFNALSSEQQKKVIIDFSQTGYINSAGIATLISVITRVRDNDGKIFFSALNSHLKRIIEIVGITDFIIITETIEEAKNS